MVEVSNQKLSIKKGRIRNRLRAVQMSSAVASGGQV